MKRKTKNKHAMERIKMGNSWFQKRLIKLKVPSVEMVGCEREREREERGERERKREGEEKGKGERGREKKTNVKNKK